VNNLEFYDNWYKTQHNTSIILYPASFRFINGQLFPISFNDINDGSNYKMILEFFGFSQYNAYINRITNLFEKNRKEIDLIIVKQSNHIPKELKSPAKEIWTFKSIERTGVLVSLQWSNNISKTSILDTRSTFLNKVQKMSGFDSTLFNFAKEFQKSIKVDSSLFEASVTGREIDSEWDNEFARKLSSKVSINSNIINTNIISKTLAITEADSYSIEGNNNIKLSKLTSVSKDFQSKVTLSKLLTVSNGLRYSIQFFKDFDSSLDSSSSEVLLDLVKFRNKSRSLNISSNLSSLEIESKHQNLITKLDKQLDRTSEITMEDNLGIYRENKKLISVKDTLISTNNYESIIKIVKTVNCSVLPEYKNLEIENHMFCAVCNNISIRNTPTFKLLTKDKLNVQVQKADINMESSNISCYIVNPEINVNAKEKDIAKVIIEILNNESGTNINIVESNLLIDKVYTEIEDDVQLQSYRYVKDQIELFHSGTFTRSASVINKIPKMLLVDVEFATKEVLKLVTDTIFETTNSNIELGRNLILNKSNDLTKSLKLEDYKQFQIQNTELEVPMDLEIYSKLKKSIHRELELFTAERLNHASTVLKTPLFGELKNSSIIIPNYKPFTKESGKKIEFTQLDTKLIKYTKYQITNNIPVLADRL